MKCFDSSAHIRPSQLSINDQLSCSLIADHVDDTDFVSLRVTQTFLRLV
jgi:hypothetical protein